jgi:hypothetical protein
VLAARRFAFNAREPAKFVATHKFPVAKLCLALLHRLAKLDSKVSASKLANGIPDVAENLYWVIVAHCRIHSLPGSPNSFGNTNRLAFSCDLCSNLVIRKFIMIKSFLSVAFATAFIGSVAFAQTSTTSTTAATGTTGATETTTTTTENLGTVTEFTPGQFLVLKTEAGQPVRYKFGKTVTYVTADGKVIEASKIRKDSKVRVHYLKDGDDMVVDKVIVTDARD